MKRRLFKLVLFLLLGAVVNVVVAWGCATSLRPRTLRHRTSSRAECVAFMANYFDIQPDGSSFNGFVIRGLSYQRRVASRSASEPWDYNSVVRIESGWPLRSLAGEWLCHNSTEARRSWYATAIMNPWLSDDEQTVNFIPYRPIWPGFAINTLFYAAILWTLTLGPFTARRMIRRKRGHCIKCGYDLRGTEHEVCPECGVAIGPPPSPRSQL